ncbi:hypothetical protein [Hydrogenophaga sp. OTU3427]|uniref:hypothetical protein n=1 Tax=Hydrogenophaga sp. OTU3427 TaxID=3043856 RepID=UPI00313BFB08
MNPDADTHADSEYEMPSAEALLAGTLALMTGHAQSACARQRSLMAAKIGSNLLFLASHPILSTSFKAVVERMRPHWAVFAQTHADAPAPPSRASAESPHLWHAAATRLQ